MGIGAACAHLGGYPDRLHDFFRRRTVPQRRLGVAANTVRTLRDVRRCDGDQLLDLGRQRAVGEDALAEGGESIMDVRRELLTCRREIRCRLWEDVFGHDALLFSPAVTTGSLVTEMVPGSANATGRRPRILSGVQASGRLHVG